MKPEDVWNWIEWLWIALTSPASTWLQTLLSGAIGAAAGSLATQSVISRHQSLSDARSEINATTHAINLSFVLLNQYTSFKKRLVSPMVAAYALEEQNVKAGINSPIRGEIAINADMQSLPILDTPVDQLERLVLERISMGGRGLSCVLQLASADKTLSNAVAERGRIIQKLEERNLAGLAFASLYLGLPTERGADTRFKDNVESIRLYTDDCVFFSHLAILDLRMHGLGLIRQHGRKLGYSNRNIPAFDFKTQDEGLIPPDNQYADWLNGFRERQRGWALVRSAIVARFTPHPAKKRRETSL